MAKYFKQGDTPIGGITDQLLDPTGTPCNVSGSTVYFLARLSGQSEPRISGTASAVIAASGQVRYTFTSTDLALPGTYNYEWEVVTAASGTYTVPTSTYGTMVVYDDIGYGALTSCHTATASMNVSAATLDTTGTQLGYVPPGAKVYAYLGTQPVAVATATSSGNFSLYLIDQLVYAIQGNYPGYTFTTRSVSL